MKHLRRSISILTLISLLVGSLMGSYAIADTESIAATPALAQMQQTDKQNKHAMQAKKEKSKGKALKNNSADETVQKSLLSILVESNMLTQEKADAIRNYLKEQTQNPEQAKIKKAEYLQEHAVLAKIQTLLNDDKELKKTYSALCDSEWGRYTKILKNKKTAIPEEDQMTVTVLKAMIGAGLLTDTECNELIMQKSRILLETALSKKVIQQKDYEEILAVLNGTVSSAGQSTAE